MCSMSYYKQQPFVWDYPGQPILEGTFTHSHLSWSSSILYLLSPSTTIHSIFPVQFTCLTVFLHNLSPSLPLGLEPSTSYFTQSSSSFRRTCPYHHNLFCCSSEIMLFIPSLSPNSFTWNSLCYIHISSLDVCYVSVGLFWIHQQVFLQQTEHNLSGWVIILNGSSGRG